MVRVRTELVIFPPRLADSPTTNAQAMDVQRNNLIAESLSQNEKGERSELQVLISAHSKLHKRRCTFDRRPSESDS